MRSDLVFSASVHISNRYQLTRLVSMATRALHRLGTRIQDTMNDVLTRFTHANPIAYLQARDEAAATAVRRRKPLTRKKPEAALELEPIVVDQPVQISKLTISLSCDLFGSNALPPGVVFTTFKPIPIGQVKEGTR
jgi:hypothetical protein